MCGASTAQQQLGQQQSQFFQTLTNQAQSVFGSASGVFNDLVSSFAPVVAAGPNQEGFSAPEKANLDSAAITNSGQAYKNASTAVKEADAAVGGGNQALPAGAEIGKNLQVAEGAAANTAGELNQINEADYATGRENYFQAASGLAQAPNVFNSSTGLDNATTNSGEAAENTENQISQENNSWVSAVTGALGQVGGAVATGGMSNLGKGLSFFGNSSGGGGGIATNGG